MSQIKHLMDKVANELGIIDPNDPRVKAECERRLTKCPMAVSHSDRPDQCRETGKVCLFAVGSPCEAYKEYLREQAPVCSNCRTELEYFSGLEFIPAYLYCPNCNDKAYDLEGNYIGKII